MFILGVVQEKEALSFFPDLVKDLINGYLRDYYYHIWRDQIEKVNLQLKLQSVKQIKIREFEMNQISVNKVILIIGNSGCGKTTILKDYLHKTKLPTTSGVYISNTIQDSNTMQDIIPNTHIYDQYNPQIVDRYV